MPSRRYASASELASDVTRETSRTVLISTETPSSERMIEDTYKELERQTLDSIHEEDVDDTTVELQRWVDARYAGQSFELRVPGRDWDTQFHALHETRYGYQRPETPVEAVTLRSTASAPGPPLDLEPLEHSGEAPRTGRTRVYVEGQWAEVDRVWRGDLSPDQKLAGPALVLEYSATTWVPRGWGLKVDKWGNLHLATLPKRQ